jgi:hypothetical protein
MKYNYEKENTHTNSHPKQIIISVSFMPKKRTKHACSHHAKLCWDALPLLGL